MVATLLFTNLQYISKLHYSLSLSLSHTHTHTHKQGIRRPLMEAQSGAEVRRLHIIYFLSRKGRIEHPHLIRVHHLSRNGIRLRDVKRWLAELRGKDMPESFAWSYKRRYKTGYLWQDLVDDDLITPISDNEYVLKGSEICSFTSTIVDSSYSEKQASMQKEASCEEDKNKSKEEKQENFETPMVVPRKSSSEIEIEEELPNFGSETSTLTDDSMKLEEDKHQDKAEQQENVQENDKGTNNSCPKSSSLYSTLLKKKTTKKKKNTNDVTMEKSKSYSNGKSHIFRNLITCGAVDTHDSAMVTINRRDIKGKMSSNNNYKANNHSAEICKREKLGGSERIYGTPWNRPEQNDARKSCDGVTESTKFCSPRTSSSAAYMPVNGPTCSQCGKQFKPEKLHRHMKSCKGMKAMAKGMISPAISVNAAEKTSQASTESSHEHSISGYYLTH